MRLAVSPMAAPQPTMPVVGRADVATGSLAPLMHAVADVYHSRELLWNLTLRELRTKYRRSFLGWAWSMLNPLATVAIYGFVFGTLFAVDRAGRRPERAHRVRLLPALRPAAVELLRPRQQPRASGAISANAGLVRRVAFPREVLVFSNVLHACVQFTIEMALLCVVLLIAGSPFLPWLPVVVLTSVLLAVFGSGFALGAERARRCTSAT